MATALLVSNIDVNAVRSEINTFLSKNGITATAAGIIVGISTTNYLRAATVDVLLPLLDLTLLGALRLVFPKAMDKVGSILFANHGAFKIERLRSFVGETVIWLVMLVSAFFVVRFVFTPTIEPRIVSGNDVNKSSSSLQN